MGLDCETFSCFYHSRDVGDHFRPTTDCLQNNLVQMASIQNTVDINNSSSLFPKGCSEVLSIVDWTEQIEFSKLSSLSFQSPKERLLSLWCRLVHNVVCLIRYLDVTFKPLISYSAKLQ